MILQYLKDTNLTVLLNETRSDPSFYMMEIGYSEPPAGSSFPNYTSGDYVLHFVTEGCGTFNGMPIRAGEGFLINAGTLYSYTFDPVTPWRHYWLRFNGSMVPVFLHSMGMKPENHTFSCPWFSSLLPEFSYLMWERPQTVDYALYEMGLLFRAMAYYKAQSIAGTRGKPAERYRILAKNFIENHYGEHISVEDIAAAIPISEKHLCQIFKEEFHMTPSEYLTEYRMRNACLLLKQTEFSIEDIAGMVGYDYPNYFSSLFHKTVGVSPRAFREKGNIQIPWNIHQNTREQTV